jgi:phosphoribosylformylglycinamidine synthase
MKFGVIVFPGSNCDHDCHHVVSEVLGHEAQFLWHKETSLDGADCLILPGGFSYGDYLRSGAMAACSPIMDSVKKFAQDGGLVIGICNGFQILIETGLLPGTLIRNDSLNFICKDIHMRVENTETPFTSACSPREVLRIPIAHMDGNYYADKNTMSELEKNGQILFRYCSLEGELDADANPNGSIEAIAGITNERGNVCGMMPHPERCSESILSNQDGVKIFEAIIKTVTGD